MKIVQIVEDLKIGGMERVIQSLALGFAARGHLVEVWCLSRGGDIAEELRAAGIKVEIMGMGEKCSLAFLLGLRSKILQGKADILHLHGYTAATVGRTAGLLAGSKGMVAHVHSTYWDYTRRQLFIEKFLSRFTARVLCCSRAVADFVTAVEGVFPGRVEVIYNGVPDMRSGQAAPEPGPGEAVTFATAASLVENKGHIFLLRALSEAHNVFPGVRLLLAGEGPLRGALEAEAARLDISANVAFLGKVTDMKKFFSGTDCAVLPSVDREGLSLFLLESLSAGKPVIATCLGGIPEVVSEGVGMLVPPRDTSALASVMLLLARDKERRNKMGAAARELYQERFSSAAMVAGVERVYDEILTR